MMFTRAAPSAEYATMLKWAKRFHASHKAYSGQRILHAYELIYRLIREHGAHTLLDYGSGKGRQYEMRDFVREGHGVVPSLVEGWGVTITPYDPAWPAYEKLPTGTFSGVVATDVLQGIPEEDMDWVLEEMMAFAERFVFARVSTRISVKKRPRGMVRRDRTEGWWVGSFLRAASRYPFVDWIVEISNGDDVPTSVYRKSGVTVRRSPELEQAPARREPVIDSTEVINDSE